MILTPVKLSYMSLLSVKMILLLSFSRIHIYQRNLIIIAARGLAA